jgi:hypothetical protein
MALPRAVAPSPRMANPPTPAASVACMVAAGSCGRVTCGAAGAAAGSGRGIAAAAGGTPVTCTTSPCDVPLGTGGGGVDGARCVTEAMRWGTKGTASACSVLPLAALAAAGASLSPSGAPPPAAG